MAVTTTLTASDIQTAITAVGTYASTCQTIFNTMDKALSELVNQEKNFLGDASKGYDTLYRSMRPVLSDQLYGGEGSVTNLLQSLLKAVQDALMGQVDPELGSMNANAGVGND